MKALVQKSANGWNIVPVSGPFEGVAMACAEGVSMVDVKVIGKSFEGTIRAVWGMTEIVDDAQIFTMGKLCHPFNSSPATKMWLDYDGLHDTTRTIVKSLTRLFTMGDAIFGNKSGG